MMNSNSKCDQCKNMALEYYIAVQIRANQLETYENIDKNSLDRFYPKITFKTTLELQIKKNTYSVSQKTSS